MTTTTERIAEAVKGLELDEGAEAFLIAVLEEVRAGRLIPYLASSGASVSFLAQAELEVTLIVRGTEAQEEELAALRVKLTRAREALA